MRSSIKGPLGRETYTGCDCRQFEAFAPADPGDKLLQMGDPVADYFNLNAVAYQTAAVGFTIPHTEDIKDDPIVRPSNLIGPTDVATMQPLSCRLSHEMQIIDVWTPNTEWGGGYADRNGTYLTIGAQEHAPLEMPRYSYAALDSDDLLAEAQARVAARYGFDNEV